MEADFDWFTDGHEVRDESRACTLPRSNFVLTCLCAFSPLPCVLLSYVDQTFAEAEPTDSPAVPGGLTDSERQQQRFDNFTYVLRAGQSLDEPSSGAAAEDPDAAEDI